MNTDSRIMLITQTRIKPGQEVAFERALQKMSDVLVTQPGYMSQEIIRPNKPIQLGWILIQYFNSIDAAKKWLQSQQRLAILQEVISSLVGVDQVYIMDQKEHDRPTVTATITHQIKPEYERQFLDWQLRVAPIQSKFPGFVGYKLEKTSAGGAHAWVAIITFDTEEHLDAWLNSAERHTMMHELQLWSQGIHLEKVYSGFNFWFAKNRPSSGSAWKENMLVLLTLYPVVFLLSYIQNPLMRHGMPFWLALFLSNMASTLILGYASVPWLTRKFGWWLNCQKMYQTILGSCVVVLLYGLSLFVCSLLSYLSV